jgi:thioester reductase-like protein
MTETYFITGASGTVGRRVTSELLKKTGARLVLLVHKTGGDLTPDLFAEQFLTVPSGGLDKRVELVRGDITKPILGMERSVYDDLAQRLTHVVHGAATTQFNLTLSDARAVNVAGTKHVLDLFMKAPQARHFAFLSTAYVAGTEIGRILEVPMPATTHFVNTYEQTKCEAEVLVRKLSQPASIYRLSTIIGDSRDGSVDHFTAPHQALRIMYLGLAAMVPGTPAYVVDLIPSDHAACAVSSLLVDETSFGHIFHITAGEERSYTLAELLEASYDNLALAEPEWARRRYPRTPIVSQEAFDLFLRSAEDAGNVFVAQVLGAMKHFAHQLNYPKEFDRTNLDKFLPTFHSSLPHIRDYYPAVVNYCLRTKFGRL